MKALVSPEAGLLGILGDRPMLVSLGGEATRVSHEQVVCDVFSQCSDTITMDVTSIAAAREAGQKLWALDRANRLLMTACDERLSLDRRAAALIAAEEVAPGDIAAELQGVRSAISANSADWRDLADSARQSVSALLSDERTLVEAGEQVTAQDRYELEKTMQSVMLKRVGGADVLFREVDQLTVLEAAELSRLLEEKWGISAKPPLSTRLVTRAEQKMPGDNIAFTVQLTSTGDKKIEVIKEVRAITGLGLKEAKDLVEGAGPRPVREGISRADAEKFLAQLEKAGAKGEIK